MARISDQMAECTVRLECSNANSMSIGSSFFHILSFGNGREAPILITNRHVVAGFDRIKLTISNSRKLRDATANNNRDIHFDRLKEVVFFHPHPNIDIACILLAPILNEAINDGSTLQLNQIELSKFVSPEVEADMEFAEDILVVGYPQGLWDSAFNLPIFRKGITATPAMIDYSGEPKFLIDCSIYPGSSGSPVFLHNRPAYIEKNSVKLGERWSLLGIVSAVMLYDANGEIIEEAVPTGKGDRIESKIPNNLGVVVKAREISVMLETLRQSIK